MRKCGQLRADRQVADLITSIRGKQICNSAHFIITPKKLFMRHILLAGLLLFSFVGARAQNHNFFADIGMSSSGDIPGVSFTYNKMLKKHLGLGGGLQGYEFTRYYGSARTTRQFMPAVFADVRAYLPVRRSLIFILADLGLNIYRGSGGGYERPHSNGLYSGLGAGYHYRATKSGLGPYISLKIASDSYIAKQDNPVTNQTGKLFSYNADMILSIGLKF